MRKLNCQEIEYFFLPLSVPLARLIVYFKGSSSKFQQPSISFILGNITKSSDSDTDKSPTKSAQAYPKYKRASSPVRTKTQSNTKGRKEVQIAARPKRMAGKKKQPEPAKPRDSTTSGTEGERLRDVRPFMVEGKRYVRHPEDDATFLVSCMYADQDHRLHGKKSRVVKGC